MADQRPAPLRLGSTAPNFNAETTAGPIDFHNFIGDKWVVLFSHPEDYTPVCTTELGAFAKLAPEFDKRGVKLIGLSANTVESHGGWIKDIEEIADTRVGFPIIGDKERKVAYAYDMYVFLGSRTPGVRDALLMRNSVGSITRTLPMSTPRALRSLSAPCSSLTPRRRSGRSCHTPLPQDATPPRCCVSWTACRRVTRTA